MRRALLLISALFVFGCAVASPPDEGSFVPDPDDETIDPNDPPTDPDPEEEALESDVRSAESVKCNKPELLSPKGLTLIFHVSKDDKNGPRAALHLQGLRRYLRAR